MDLTIMGTIGSYTKTWKMQTQWNIKKQSGNVTSHSASLHEWLNAAPASSDSQEKTDSKKLGAIMQKVYAGGKLTGEEKAYLQAKDPMTYQKLQSMEQEQKSYEQELKKCKTKEDVQRLKMSRIGSSLATVKSIENNPHITQEKKLQMVSLENRRCEKLEASTRRFIQSGEYEKLPTEAEQAKAEKELHETEQVQKNPEVEKIAQTAKTNPDGKAVQTDTENKAPETPVAKREVRAGTAKPESPEVRKVRRAKAKAAYIAIRDSVSAQSDVVWNVQA